MPHRLDSLLRSRSIAVLGATERIGTVGRNTVENLLKGGFEGRLYAVNPGRTSVCGVPCFPSLAALPEPVEHVIFAISDARVEAALEDVIGHGARAVRLTKQAINRSLDMAGLREALAQALETDVMIETSETAESREFNAILRKDGAKAAIAWRSARAAQTSSGKGS